MATITITNSTIRKMPSKNSLKVYVENGYYHIYNRGVEKRDIFLNEQDYSVFLKYLKEYLSPPPDPTIYVHTVTVQGRTFNGITKRLPNNYYQEIDLLAYCLMPNHLHLLIKQKSKNSITEFIRSILTRYSMYFNKKYDRIGPLFQGKYKAVFINKDNYLLHLSRYIHLNPRENIDRLTDAYSSYSEYLGLRKTTWVKPEFILSFFAQAKLGFLNKPNTYKDFVENFMENTEKTLKNLIIE